MSQYTTRKDPSFFIPQKQEGNDVFALEFIMTCKKTVLGNVSQQLFKFKTDPLLVILEDEYISEIAQKIFI